MKYSKIIVALIVVLNVVFIYRVLEIFSNIGVEPTSSIVAWFGFTTGELWLLSGIKKEKVKQGGVEFADSRNEYKV